MIISKTKNYWNLKKNSNVFQIIYKVNYYSAKYYSYSQCVCLTFKSKTKRNKTMIDLMVGGWYE